MQRITLKDWRGKMIGFVDVEPNGDKMLRDFRLRILGYYNAKLDVTQDYYRRTVARGDVLTTLLNNND